MKKSTKIILVSIICIWLIFFTTDYILVKKQKNPIFCLCLNAYLDGGTQEYFGLGYKVFCFNKLLGETNSIKIDGDERTFGSANYNYLCPIYYSYEKAWSKVEERAMEYSREKWAQYAKENPYIKKEEEANFTELFEKYYGKEKSENLYNQIEEEQKEKAVDDLTLTKSQKEQVSIVLEFLDRNIISNVEKEIFKDWLKGINPENLNDEELQTKINNL